jgi:TolB protein
MRKPRLRLPILAASLLAAAFTLPGIFAQPPEPTPPPATPTAPADAPQDKEVTLVLDRGGVLRKMKLAVPAFKGTAGLAGDGAAGAGELEATVRQDLAASGFFEIQGPEILSGLALTGDLASDLAVYRSTGNEVLILGELRQEADKGVFEGRVLDLGSGQAILAKRYRGGWNVARRMGHTFADEVIHFLTGKVGINMTSIAFTSDRTGAKEIFIVDYDGANPRRITGHRSTSMSPAWNKAGDTLAYTSFFNGPAGIYLADLGSGRKRPLVTSGSLNSSPSFAPDGRQVAFARSLDGNVEIFTADLSGAGLRRLTHSGAIDTNPAWSPKGSDIAFTSSRAGNPNVYLMDAEGANVRRVTFEGTYNDGASWSPDGDLIAYASRRDGRFQIAVTNVVTLATKVLTSGPGENESPTFAPDGRKLAFVSRRTGKKQIWVMDLAGENLRQLTQEGNNDMPDWSRLASER